MGVFKNNFFWTEIMFSIQNLTQKWSGFAAVLIASVIFGGPLASRADESTVSGGIEQAQLISQAFQETSKAVIPSVVKIVVKSGENDKKKSDHFLPFGDFFSDLNENDSDIEGVGSGVLVDADGVVLTNHHVVTDSKNILVELFDGRQFDVDTVNKDPLSDLAVLKLKTDEKLPSLAFADSDALEIGDWVLAIGNPFMLESSVSAGIVSAKGRFLSDKDRGSFIQTDAAINPGNSGGPLVNLKGQIVGINTAIASLTGGYQGIGFAIPSNTARWIMNQLIEKGRVDRAFLGLPLEPISYEESKKLGLAPRSGVKARTPFRDSPAAKSGLKSNDIILAFDDQPIDSAETLQLLVEAADINVEHQLTILRKGEKNRRNLSVRLEIIPDDYVGVPQTENLVEQGVHYNDRPFGLILIPLTDDAAGRLGLEAAEGLVVLSVFPGSPAWRAGLRDGMCIVKINGQPVSSTEDYQRIRNAPAPENGTQIEALVKEETKTFLIKKPVSAATK